jgi:hypothetical protein
MTEKLAKIDLKIIPSNEREERKQSAISYSILNQFV